VEVFVAQNYGPNSGKASRFFASLREPASPELSLHFVAEDVQKVHVFEKII
jgi:hypothetical protein